MKKLALMLCAATALTAGAADYSVLVDGALQPGLDAFVWWNVTFDFGQDAPDGTKAMSFKAADGGAAASMGLFANDGTGPLHSATLNFDWYAVGDATYTVRLTAANGGPEQDYKWTVTSETAGKWNNVSLSVAETFPAVAAAWDENTGRGAGYVFSVILDGGEADDVIYFSNVRYTDTDESWVAPVVETFPAPTTVPVPTLPASDVVSIFGSHYPQAVGYGIGGWGQTTVYETMSIDGSDVAHLTHFNYLGFEFASHIDVAECNYVHVDYYTTDGSSFGFTPISPGQERGWIAPEVKKGEWNSFDVPLSYFSNVVFSDLFQFKFDQGKGDDVYLTNIYFYKKADDTPEVPGDHKVFKGTISSSVDQNMGDDPKTYPYTIDYTIAYNEDKTLTINAVYNWANGEPIGVVPGTVYVNNIGTDFTMNGNARVATTADTYEAGELLNVRFFLPMALGVVQDEFQYTVNSGDENTTPDDPIIPTPGATYTGTVSGTVAQTDNDGEHTYAYDINYSISYNDDETLTITAELVWNNGEPFGLVPGTVFVDGMPNEFTIVDGKRTVTTTEKYDGGSTVNVNFYMPAGAGAVVQSEVLYIVGKDGSSLVEAAVIDQDAAPVYYNLSGVRVDNPANGLYIMVKGGKATKVIL